MKNGYDFYFDTVYGLVTLPISPSELSIKVDSNNEVVSLINEGDINILKAPSLIEVEFEARFPMRKYPYSREPSSFQSYFNIFKKLKEQKMPFRFIVVRATPDGKRTWDTNLLMALESFELKESADEGDDVLISFSLKQYKEYGLKRTTVKYTPRVSTTTKVVKKKTTTSTSKKVRPSKTTKVQRTHTVKKGDTLWAISKKYYGNGAKYKVIYNKNKSLIESTARKHGKKSSSNGHWIWEKTKLIIPSL